jgi:hypothetical protein
MPSDIEFIVAPLACHAYVFSDEVTLHNSIAKVLDRHAFTKERESTCRHAHAMREAG